MLLSREVFMFTLRPTLSVLRRLLPPLVVLALGAVACAPLRRAQPTPPSGQPPQPDQATPEATPDSGGPSGDSGVIALPKKKDKTEDAVPIAPAIPKTNNPEGAR